MSSTSELPRSLQSALRRWLSGGAARAGWAILEQGTFSLSNWLLQTLLVRWLGNEAEFGAFSVAFAWFLLVGAAHNSLVVEPMMVYGGKRYAGKLQRYFGSLALGSVAVSVIAAVVLAGIGIGYAAGGQSGIALACWSLAGAAPFVFLSWLMRRTSYVNHKPHRSAVAGVVYLVVMVGGFAALERNDLFSVPTATAIMALAGLLAAVWLMGAERIALPFGTTDDETGRSLTAAVADDHWRLGRWMLLSGMAGIAATQWFFVAAPWMTGVNAGGAMRALTNLFQPVSQAIIALTAILVPVMVRAVGTSQYRNTVRRALQVMTGGPIVAWLICGLNAEWIVTAIYRGHYAQDAQLVWVVGLQPVAAGLIAVWHAELCVAGTPERMFAASAVSLAFTLTIGSALMVGFGLWGMALAMLGAMLVDALMSLYFVRKAAFVPAAPSTPPGDVREEIG